MTLKYLADVTSLIPGHVVCDCIQLDFIFPEMKITLHFKDVIQRVGLLCRVAASALNFTNW